MSSEIRLKKIYPKEYRSSYIEMADGEVIIFPQLKADRIVSNTSNKVEIQGWDLSDVCTLTTNQQITGLKTFMQIPILPGVDPTLPNHAVRMAYLRTEIDAIPLIPIGTVLPFAGAENKVPEGYFLCDGDSYNKSDYAELFDVIEYTYSDTNSGYFHVPDLRARVPVGYASAVSNFNALGKMDGEVEHRLTTDEMPAHYHVGKLANYPGGGYTPGGYQDPTMYSVDYDTTSTGGGGLHNNLQPYITLNFIIYHGVF